MNNIIKTIAITSIATFSSLTAYASDVTPATSELEACVAAQIALGETGSVEACNEFAAGDLTELDAASLQLLAANPKLFAFGIFAAASTVLFVVADDDNVSP